MQVTSPVSVVAPGVFRIADVCNVYVVTREAGQGERTAFAVDFGSGLVLDHLADMGVDRLTDVLMTHHHRDQGQGLHRAVAAGVRIHVPPVERELFSSVDEFWRTRPLANDYSVRQDRFSLLDPVPAAGLVPEYRTASYAGTEVGVLPTPGHTIGSVSYLVERAGRLLAFTGDLIYAPGQVWSLAATQWTYSGVEGAAMTVLSCYQLLERGLDVLLPSHGEPMGDPRAALDLLAGRMQRYVDSRRPHPWDLRARLATPYAALTEHLLHNVSSEAKSYVLVSRTGAALLFDYGYDMITGLPPDAGTGRASRRPWLASLPALRRDHGVTSIEVAVPTHYHDDHVAAMNLLREVEGTQVWAPANMTGVLERPREHDLPALWYDPIPVDRVLPMGASFTWREYEITVHDLPGHTLFAAAYEVEVDGVRVVVSGDQQDGGGEPGGRHELLNYQYRNRFGRHDFERSAALYRAIAPDLMVSGHWPPRWVDDAYLDLLAAAGQEVARLHRELLPLDHLDLGTDGVAARIEPYYSRVETGSAALFRVTVRNPFRDEQVAVLRLVTPAGWGANPAAAEVKLPAPGSLVSERVVEMEAVVHGPALRRSRVAVDVTIGDLRLGQHAEALVDVVEPAGDRVEPAGDR